MSSPGIVDGFDEARQRGGDVVEGPVVHLLDLFDLERLHEALGLGAVVGIAAPPHGALEPVLDEPAQIALGGILRTAIGVMDAVCRRRAG